MANREANRQGKAPPIAPGLGHESGAQSATNRITTNAQIGIAKRGGSGRNQSANREREVRRNGTRITVQIGGPFPPPSATHRQGKTASAPPHMGMAEAVGSAARKGTHSGRQRIPEPEGIVSVSPGSKRRCTLTWNAYPGATSHTVLLGSSDSSQTDYHSPNAKSPQKVNFTRCKPNQVLRTVGY